MNTRRIALGGALLLAIASGLGGCKSVSKAQYDAAVQENSELRDRLATLQDSVRQGNGQSQSLESANQQLASENARLQALVDSGQTGFEGIAGTSVARRGDAIAVTVAGDVLFDSGSVSLKSSAKSSLDRVVSVLQRQYSGNAIRVEGYTDTDPIKKSDWKTNERLSSERALAVESYLVTKGVENERVYSAAFGPAVQRATKKDSRRVEIVILGNS
ncbi:MAG: chemotaxis protein MotB [Phycisphaerales bacterium]|jgi:chemotaxis protein MotB